MTQRISITNGKSLCAAAIGLALLQQPSQAADFYLCAGTTTKTMPDTGEVVTMWGFAEDDNANLTDGCGAGAVSVPGPRLSVPAGDAVLNIHLRNDLPQPGGADAAPLPVSVIIPGQIGTTMTPVWIDASATSQTVTATGSRTPGDYTSRARSFTAETAPGAVHTYTWNNPKPGTFLYESGTHPAVQVQMGLYGMVTVEAPGPAPASHAYPGVAYDQEVVLLYSEIDPAFHAAVAAQDYGPGKSRTSAFGYRPQYFLINGQAYSSSTPPDPISVGNSGGRILMRFLNAGLDTHVPVLQGMHLSVLAEDGNPYPFAREQHSIFLPAGKTKDALLTVDCTATQPGDYAIYDRRLRLTNAASPNGGMFHYIRLADIDADGVASMCDNCINESNGPNTPGITPANIQRDSNGDGYGNVCDTDLNGDLSTNAFDLNILRSAWLSSDADADFNGDGTVNVFDLNILRSRWLSTPGPSGVEP